MSQFIFDAIFVVTVCLAALVTALIGALITLKTVRIHLRRREERMLRSVQPALEEYLASGSPKLPASLSRPRRIDRGILKYALIRRSFGSRGEVHGRIAHAYDRLGFIAEDEKALASMFWWRRAEAARCLGQMRHAASVPPLLKGLRDRSLEMKLLCAWALGRIGDVSTVPQILENLAGVSKLAGMRLSSTVFELGEKAIGPLIDITGHREAPVRLLAIHLLAELKDPRILPAMLRKGAGTEPKEIRIAACKALGTLGYAEGVPRLIELLAEPEFWELRAQAAKALGKLQAPPEALAALSKAMEDQQWWVRRNAGEALFKNGRPGLAALRRVAKDSKDRYGRDMAVQWLNEHESH